MNDPRFAIVVTLLACGCKRHEPSEGAKPPSPEEIPHTNGSIKVDGEWDEPDWSARALRGQFRADDGQLARPSSEARFLHDGSNLLIALYAADENIETADAFDVTVGALQLHVDATGNVTPPIAGVHAAVGYDEGTRDNPNDEDEEWVVELGIPLATVGLRAGVHQTLRSGRCDTPKDGVRRCGTWSGSLTLESSAPAP